MLLRNQEPKKFRLRRLLVPVLLVGLVYFGYGRYLNWNLNKGNEYLAAGNYEKSRLYFRKAADFPLSKGRGHDGLGALALLEGDLDEARAHFKVILGDKPRGFGGQPQIVLREFISRGDYPHAQTYVDFLKNWKGTEAWLPYSDLLAAVALGNRDLDGALAYLDNAPSELKRGELYKDLDQRCKKYSRNGLIPVLFDRNGTTLLNYDTKSKSYAFSSPTIFSGWAPRGSVGESLPADVLQNAVDTTIDLNLQKAANFAMKDFQGTMVLVQPGTGEILAAYGSGALSPCETTFEPGSVIKMLTYGLYLQSGGDTSAYAPKTYASTAMIGGKLFMDWTTQGMLPSIDEGMAVSCNLMFAQMGVDLSMGRWMKGAKQLFDGETRAGLIGEGLYGRVRHDPEDAYALGRAAIGLDYLETTALGLCLIPLAIADQGQVVHPFLFKSYHNTLGQTYRQESAKTMPDLFSGEVAAKLKTTLRAPLTSPRGTARRAAVEFVKAGMKTGTAGEQPYDSIMIGMFPIDEPKVVFALYLSGGGKCEINGALVAKRLQEQIKALAPEYLE